MIVVLLLCMFQVVHSLNVFTSYYAPLWECCLGLGRFCCFCLSCLKTTLVRQLRQNNRSVATKQQLLTTATQQKLRATFVVLLLQPLLGCRGFVGAPFLSPPFVTNSWTYGNQSEQKFGKENAFLFCTFL